jgi:hypothetical protein
VFRRVEFDRYRLTSVRPIRIRIPIRVSVSVRYESNRYRFEINNKLDIGIGWKCNKVSIGSISVNIGNKHTSISVDIGMIQIFMPDNWYRYL